MSYEQTTTFVDQVIWVYIFILLLLLLICKKKNHMCSVNGCLFDVINQWCKDVYDHDYIVWLNCMKYNY